MKPISFRDLTITHGFWADKQRLVAEKTAQAVYDRFSETGRILTMDCVPRESVKPHVFWGSDVFKWMEGAADLLVLAKQGVFSVDTEKLEKQLDAIIRDVEKGTTSYGYYNSAFNVSGEKRFSDRNKHELYSLGHMTEAAVALAEATGDRRLLEVCRRNVALADRVFRVENSAAFTTPGHEELELALVRLYRLTGDPSALTLASYFIDQRGNNPKDTPVLPRLDPSGAYCQSHRPVREQTEAVGHAVRAAYLYCGMVDVAAETGDESLLNAAKRLFDDIYDHKMYITGSIGTLAEGEAFSSAGHLPNREAYAETCAALALALFATRLANQDPDGRYGDAAERAVYNGMMAGLSLDGEAFFYEDPLEIDLERQRIPYSHQAPAVRQKVFSCSCCPPNLVRFIPSVGDLIAGEDEDRLYIHQYIPCEGEKLAIRTDCPLDGKVSADGRGKKLALRKPFWCGRVTASAPYREEKGYLYFDTDRVDVDFEMQPFFCQAATAVHEDRGQAALCRGPVIYCAEGQDQTVPLHALRVDPEGAVRVTEDRFGGLPVLEAEGFAEKERRALYTRYRKEETPARIRLIPYYAFANRGEDNMLTWLRV